MCIKNINKADSKTLTQNNRIAAPQEGYCRTQLAGHPSLEVAAG